MYHFEWEELSRKHFPFPFPFPTHMNDNKECEALKFLNVSPTPPPPKKHLGATSGTGLAPWMVPRESAGVETHLTVLEVTAKNL